MFSDGAQLAADQVRVLASSAGAGWSTFATGGDVQTSRAPVPAYQPIRYAFTITGPDVECR